MPSRLCSQHDLADHLPLTERIERVRRSLQRIRRRDVRFDLPFLEPFAELHDIRAMARSVSTREGADPNTDDAATFDERQVERDLGNVARSKSDHQESSTPGHVAKGELGIRAADGIVDDVDT